MGHLRLWSSRLLLAWWSNRCAREAHWFKLGTQLIQRVPHRFKRSTFNVQGSALRPRTQQWEVNRLRTLGLNCSAPVQGKVLDTPAMMVSFDREQVSEPALPDTDAHLLLSPPHVVQDLHLEPRVNKSAPNAPGSGFSLAFNTKLRSGLIPLRPPTPGHVGSVKELSVPAPPGHPLPHQPRLETRPVRWDRTSFHFFRRHH